MDIGEIIGKIVNQNDSRELYEVPVHLCLDRFSGEQLLEEAKRSGVVNQLGALIDLTLLYLIPKNHPRYSTLQNLRSELYPQKRPEKGAFYEGEPSELTNRVEGHMRRLNEPKMYDILVDWNLVVVLSPDKFKQVFDQENEVRQQAAVGRPSYD